MRKRSIALVLVTAMLFGTTVNAASTRSSNIKSSGVFISKNAAGQSVKFDSADLRSLAVDIDNLESSYNSSLSSLRSGIAGAIRDAGNTTVNANSSIDDLCSAISGLGDTAVSELINGTGHEVASFNSPLDIKLSADDHDHSMHIANDTWRKEFTIYKDENNNPALLSYINFNIYGQKRKAYLGQVNTCVASYTIKTDTGRILKSGNIDFAWENLSGSTLWQKSAAACTPVILNLFGAGVGNAQKVIIEVTYNLQCRTDSGDESSTSFIWLKVDDCSAYYINR